MLRLYAMRFLYHDILLERMRYYHLSDPQVVRRLLEFSFIRRAEHISYRSFF